MYIKQIFLFLFFVQSLSTLAEIPRPPEVNKYFSENGKYMLIVHPTKKKINNKKSEEVKIQCHGILFQINENDTIKMWKKELVNRIMPLCAIVANNGKSIATFDCYYRNRDGVDAMVLYGKDGKLKRRFNLKDFSPFPIEVYEFTMSQLLWRCGAKFNNNHEIEICFKKPDDKTKTINYNIKTQSFK